MARKERKEITVPGSARDRARKAAAARRSDVQPSGGRPAGGESEGSTDGKE